VLRSLIVTIALAAAVLLAACGDESGSEVRPFSEVQATDFAFETDPNAAGRGIFRMQTTEPMICAIVWGPTEELGNFNNSLAMNGTGIINHDVFLPGAEVGVTYFFRVQGSTADGTLYQSPLATFTLDGEPVVNSGEPLPIDAGANLAPLGGISDVSSEFSTAWAASNAIDGDLSTEWSSAGDGDDAFITLDLGEVRAIAGVEYVTRSMADGSAITTVYSIVVDDGERLGPF
jgi:F5/8 type C domain